MVMEIMIDITLYVAFIHSYFSTGTDGESFCLFHILFCKILNYFSILEIFGVHRFDLELETSLDSKFGK